VNVQTATGNDETRYCPVCFTETGETVLMEPELDWPYRFFECEECGTSEGYVYVGATEDNTGSCEIGLPEALRSRLSAVGDEQDRADRMRQIASPEAVEARLRALPMFQPKESP